MNSKWNQFLYEAQNGEQSAGVLLYKFRDGQYYVYLVHDEIRMATFTKSNARS